MFKIKMKKKLKPFHKELDALVAKHAANGNEQAAITGILVYGLGYILGLYGRDKGLEIIAQLVNWSSLEVEELELHE
jgi:hypothetical protein